MARLDGSTSARPLRLSYLHVTGKLALSGGGAVTYESPLERDWLIALDFDPSVVELMAQPMTLNYQHEGRTRRYTPDIKATFEDGSVIVYEVKPRETLHADWLLLRPRFKAAVRYCRQRGWRFRIVTERHIRTPFVSNATFLRQYRQLPTDWEKEGMLLRSLTATGETTVRTLLRCAYWDETNRLAAVPYLWKLVATHKIGTALIAPLTMDSVIWMGVD